MKTQRGRPKGSKGPKVVKKIVKKTSALATPAKTDYFAKLQSLAGNEYLSLTETGEVNEVKKFIDTGSYTLNALLSGSIFGGIPQGRIIAYAGEEATGKSFFTYEAIKEFLTANPNGGVIHFESEQHPDEVRKMMQMRSIDTNRVYILPIATLQELKVQATRIVNNVLKLDLFERRPMMMTVDSLGMLSTSKEMADAESGKDVRDMTRTQLIRGIFRVLTLKCAMADITMIITNHTYQVIGSYFPIKEMAGGGGLRYAASEIVYLNSNKERDKDKNITGANIKAVLAKGRITKEFKCIVTQLDHNKGLQKYAGLIDFAIAANIWKKVDKKIYIDKNSAVFESKILITPEQYFTKEVLDKIDVWTKTEFLYGSPGDSIKAVVDSNMLNT